MYRIETLPLMWASFAYAAILYLDHRLLRNSLQHGKAQPKTAKLTEGRSVAAPFWFTLGRKFAIILAYKLAESTVRGRHVIE